ncbi:MAG TPA: S-methyl-5-thioribose-1-phosphate isomerase [candidate division Zixibacteria bacterium]|nr:S-methyl-5-thioribose-1-phosphate isomerase [candidate division Zixibacteria bacterium]
MTNIPKAVAYTDGRLRLIDQTALPSSLTHIETDDYREVIAAIKRLAVRGAPAIGIAGAYGVALAAREALTLPERERADFLHTAMGAISAARPTAVNLPWAIQRVRDVVGAAPTVDAQLVTTIEREGAAIAAEDEAMCRKIGQHGAALIGQGAGVLTICNTGALATGGIGTALGAIYIAHEQGKAPRVYACETRPALQGSRLTVWELLQSGVTVTLIVDSAAAVLMAEGKVDLVIVGADRIAANGDTANKIGTYALATLAAAHDLPFYVAAPRTTFDPATESLDNSIIEQRDPNEIRHGFGALTAPETAPVYSPAFDITPRRLITGYITDEGITLGGRASG